MEIILGIVLGILVILNVLLFWRLSVTKMSSNELVEKINKLEMQLIKEFGDFRNNFSRDLNNDFEKLNEKIDQRLNYIN